MNLPATVWWRDLVNFRVLGILLLGQLVSLVVALHSFCSSLIAKQGVNTPLTQSLHTFTPLALIYGSILVYRNQKPLVSWYWYLLLAFADVHGNYLMIEANQYTTITSVTLLYSCTIPWVIILTWFFLGTRYSLWQLSGAAICVLGLCLVLFSDTGSSGGGSRPILGDILVISGTLLSGISNVGMEFCAKRTDPLEVLCMIGLSGFIVLIVEAPIVELKTLESVKWSTNIVLSFIGFGVASATYYTIAPFFLKIFGIWIICNDYTSAVAAVAYLTIDEEREKRREGNEWLDGAAAAVPLQTIQIQIFAYGIVYNAILGGAAMFNLSIMTSNMWAMLFKIFIYHEEVSWLHFLSYAITIAGLIIYTTTGKDSIASAIEDESPNTEYQIISNEHII